jgi:hypothetical protein
MQISGARLGVATFVTVGIFLVGLGLGQSGIAQSTNTQTLSSQHFANGTTIQMQRVVNQDWSQANIYLLWAVVIFLTLTLDALILFLE